MICSNPKPVRKAALRAALKFEFDLPYEEGRMGRVNEAVDAFSTRLEVKR